MKKDILGEPIKVRLPKKIEEKFRSIAKRTGKSLSEIIRQNLSEERIILNQKPPAINRLTSKTLMFYFSKTSNNLNQIAKKINQLAQADELDANKALEFLDVLEAIYLELWNAIERVENHGN